ncbi:TonB-dependent receptor [Glaciecola sp. 1036]|uniref:TonB-dependent receptor n=1 Tax=Alteromonadaceae TaxID=72275 RepID=UPI003CFE290E
MKHSLVLTSIFTLFTPSLLSAQEDSSTSDLERITVTADLMHRDLSQLPGSAIVLDELAIQKLEARHLQDLIPALPNVNFSAGATRGKFIQIRGIGERSQFSEPTNPSVGLLLDDIDISGLGALATVFDIQQVELLSGPQSVASGINSLAGIIKLVSQPASLSSSSRFAASYAEYGEKQIGFAHGISITEEANLRLSAQQTSSDGFVTNDYLNRDDTNGIDELTASVFLNYQLGEQAKIDLRYYRFDIDNGYDAFSLDNDNHTLSDEPGFDRADAHAMSLKYTGDYENFSVQTKVSYLTSEFDYGYDEDWTYTGFHPWGYTSFDRYLRDVERTSAEVKLGSVTATDIPWLVGVNYTDTEEDLLREYTYNEGDFTSFYAPESASIFGQYGWSLTDDLRINTAARVELFDADYVDSDGFSESIDDTLVAASASLEYQLSKALIYTTIARGYKAGGFNIDQRLTGSNRTFAPEFNWSAEFGVKGQALDGLADIAVSVFYMRRKDAQVNDFATFETVTDEGTVITSFADAIRNTDTGINKGIEVVSQFFVKDNWTLQANLGLLRATFGDYNLLNGDFVPKQDQAQAPTYTLYLSSNYELNENLVWFIGLDAKDEYRFSDGHNEKAPFTLVVNSHLSYQIGKNVLSLWVKNLFDRTVYTRGFGGFSNDPRDEYAFEEPYFQFGQPRQIGVSYQYQF